MSDAQDDTTQSHDDDDETDNDDGKLIFTFSVVWKTVLTRNHEHILDYMITSQTKFFIFYTF